MSSETQELRTALVFDAGAGRAGIEEHRSDVGQLADAIRQLVKGYDGAEKASSRAGDQVQREGEARRKLGRQILTAVEALERETRVKDAAARIAQEWNLSTTTASKVATKYAGDLAKIQTEGRQYAEALDRVDKALAAVKAGQLAAAKAARQEASARDKANRQAAEAVRKLEAEVRVRRSAKIIADRWNISTETAARVSRRFAGDLDRLEKEARESAIALDRLERESRDVARAQKTSAALTAALSSKMMGLVVQLAAVVGGAAAVKTVIRQMFTAFQEMETGLIKVSKTTNLEGVALENLSDSIKDMATDDVPVAMESLYALGEAAGQMGINTAEGLDLAITTGAQLERATVLAGDEALLQLARILGIQRESIDNIDNLGSSLTHLGNTVRGNEGEILSIGSEVSRAIGGNFEVASHAVLGLSATLVGFGANAESSATAVQKLFFALQSAAQTGDNLAEFARVAGVTEEQLRELVSDDIMAAAVQFLGGIGKEGDQAGLVLKSLGLRSVRTLKNLLPLAKGVEELEKNLKASEKAFKENTALQEEADKAFSDLESQISKLQNAWKILLGTALEPAVPLIKELVNDLVEFVRKAIAWHKEINESKEQWGEFVDQLSEALPLLGPLKLGVVALLNPIKLLAEGIRGFFRLLTSLPTAIPDGLFSLARLAQGVGEVAGTFAGTPLATSLGLDGLSDVANRVARELSDLANAAAGYGVEAIKGSKATEDLADGNEDSADAAKELKEQLQQLLAQIENQEKAVEDEGKAHKAVYDAKIKSIRDELAELEKTQKFIEESTQEREGLALFQRGLGDDRQTALNFTPDVDYDISFTDWKEVEKAGKEYAETVREETIAFAEQALSIFDQLSGTFDSIGGKFGDFLSTLTSIVSTIGGSVANLATAGGGDGQLGQYAEQLGYLGDVVAIFTGIYDIANQLIEQGRLNNYGLPIEAGRSEGVNSGQAIASRRGALNQQEVERLVDSLFDAFDSFAFALGRLVLDIETIGIEVRNDGEKIILTVGGIVHGTFETIQDAIEHGLRVAFSTASIEGLGENMQRALERRMGGLNVEEFLALIPTIQALDDMAAGMGLSLSAATLEARQFLTYLDITSQQLLRVGASLEDVIALREAMLAQRKRELELSGLSLAGVNSQADAIKDWLEQVEAYNTAAREEAERHKELAEWAEQAASEAAEITGRYGRNGGGGRPGRIQDVYEGSNLISGALVSMFGEIDRGGPAAADAATAMRLFNEQMQRLVTAVAVANEQISVYDRVIAFLETYGGDVEQIEEFKAKKAELEFMVAKAQILLAIKQLEILYQQGLLTDKQWKAWQDFAADIAGFEYPGAPDTDTADTGPRRPGRGAGLNDRERAAESFARSLRDISDALAEVTPAQRAYRDQVAQLREDAEAGRVGLERLNEALQGLATLQAQRAAAPYEQAIQRAGESDIGTRLREAGERAALAFADAAEAATAAPEAYAAARAAIERGLELELAQIGQQGLAALGGQTAQLEAQHAAIVRAVTDIMSHLEELGLTAQEVRQAVQEGALPGLLSMIEAQAQRVGDERLAAQIARRRSELELTIQRLQFEQAVALLRLVEADLDPALLRFIRRGRQLFDLADNALGDDGGSGGSDGPEIDTKALREALRDLHREGLSPAIASLIEATKRHRELRRQIDATNMSEEARAAALALVEADAARARRDAVGSLVSELESLARAAGVDLPVEQARRWAEIQFELARAQALVALQTPAMVRAFRELGLDIGEFVELVSGLELPSSSDPDRNASLTQRVAERKKREGEDPGIRPGGSDPDPDEEEDVGETLAEILAGLSQQGLTPLEELQARWAEVFDRIAEASGTAEERTQAAALAQQLAAQEYAELVAQQTSGLSSLREELNAAIDASNTPREAVINSRAEFEAAAGAVDLNDQASIDRLEAAARAYLERSREYAESTGATETLNTTQSQVQAILDTVLSAVPAPPDFSVAPDASAAQLAAALSPSPVQVPPGALLGSSVLPSSLSIAAQAATRAPIAVSSAAASGEELAVLRQMNRRLESMDRRLEGVESHLNRYGGGFERDLRAKKEHRLNVERIAHYTRSR